MARHQIEEKEEISEEERKRRELKKEKQKKKLEKKEHTKVKPRKSHELIEIEIPLIKLEESKIKPKEVEINKEIPVIDKEDVEIIIPIVKINHPISEFREIQLDKELPLIEPIKKEIKVPLIKLGKSSKIRDLISSFNSQLPLVKRIGKTVPKIPIYRIFPSPTIREIQKSFDKSVYKQISKQLTTQPEVEKPITTMGEPPAGEEKEELEEIPEITEIVIGLSSKNLSGNPKVLCVKEPSADSYTGMLRYLCWRIYREKEGGRADPKIISNISRKEFKKEIEEWMKAENKVFSVEFREGEKIEEGFWQSIGDRLEELFGQGIGFIIFKNLLFLYQPKHHLIDILNISPNEKLANNVELKKSICSLMWGLVDIRDEDIERYFSTKSSKFDHIFEVARKKFEEKLRRIGEPYLSATMRHKGLRESDDMHFPVKLFVVKYLSNELGYSKLEDVVAIKRYVHTEEEFNVNKFGLDEEKYPDIYVNGDSPKFSNEVFEIETLFGEGEYSIEKIGETIGKYVKSSNTPSKVNIVLDNFTFLLHLKELRDKKKIHNIFYKNGDITFQIEFWTLDVKHNKLISLKEVLQKLKTVLNMLK